ncbi:MAG TPA: site-2 protease family protein [Oscillatoriaceae cyanobacterium]
MNFLDWHKLFVLMPLFIVSITLHEWGHAAMANALGDDTPRRAGRLTLNPIAHLDLYGTLVLFFFGFGWAKPVPVSLHHTKNPRLANVLVSFAGPAMNLLQMAVGVVALRSLTLSYGAQSWFLDFAILNAILFVFNLLPIPPLDGSHLLEVLLPARWWPAYRQMQPFGMAALVVIMFLPAHLSPINWLLDAVGHAVVALV